ncbi:hypothetical protein ACFLR5_00670 [Elusimicrobiota bacterium]
MFKKFIEHYKKLIKIGKKIAAFQTRLVFSIAYFTFVVPLGLFLKLFPGKHARGWQASANYNDNLESARKQF